jgi:FecR protein
MVWLLTASASAQSAATKVVTRPSSPSSQVIEVAGTVEFQTVGAVAWIKATNGQALLPGDRLRTRAQSRAAVQFTDRSVLRLSEKTTLEIQPPRRAEKARFRLPVGSLFFFNREKPADVEFETPVVSGAIRGTEFVLESAEANGATQLALLDGAVELVAANETVLMQSGERASVEPGQPPVKSPLLEVASLCEPGRPLVHIRGLHPARGHACRVSFRRFTRCARRHR